MQLQLLKKRWTSFVFQLLLILFIAAGAGWYMFNMPGHSYRGALPPLSQEEIRIRDRLVVHVNHLAGKIGERNIWHDRNLQLAAEYITSAFKKLGYSVSEQDYRVHDSSVKNIIAERRGVLHPEEIIVIGAHYDSIIGSPGADDNASGVATILECARLLATIEPKRTVRFIAFVNEEPPFFYTDQMGSYRYAQAAKQKQENIVAMLSIESIGYYSDKPHSQYYPFPFSFFYPHTANFIGFVGNLSSRTLTRAIVAAFRQHASFPSEGIAAPSWIMGVGWSDQWSFWKQGYRAVMVTGTALFRNPHYHTEYDTPETLDYDRMARVVNGLMHVIQDLANQK